MRRIPLLLLIYFCCIAFTFAQPGNYYSSINPNAVTFITDLQQRIRNPYTRISYDNFINNINNFASINNSNGSKSVFCVYSNFEYNYTGNFSWGVMSREHTFCHSWMPNESTSRPEYSDQHHLFPTNQNSANGIRSNHPLGNVVNATNTFLEAKYGTDALGRIVYEPRNNHKGDAARALLYMSLRYNGIDGYDWTFNWLNNVKLPSLGEAPQNLATLIAWHKQDPPDKWEIDRNNYIQSFQQNRNPFVDHPEYVNYINFNNLSKLSPVYASEPSNYASNLQISIQTSSITISWTDALPSSQAPSGYLLLGYNKDDYFLPIDGETYNNDYDLSDGFAIVNIPYEDINNYTFSNLPAGNYYFTIFSYNGNGSQRNFKINGEIPRISTNLISNFLPNAWINEFHYDNSGTDVNEFVEVVIPNIYNNSTELAKFSVVLYNGTNGASYSTTTLNSFTKGNVDSLNGISYYYFIYPTNGIENGSPDGIALGYNNKLIQFISYEGFFTAVGGIANGVTSTDIGVSQSSTTPIGSSIGLTGSGRKYDDYTWTSFSASTTMGAANAGQSILPRSLNISAIIEGLFNGVSMIPDTITVELKNPVAPFPTLESRKILLNNQGYGFASFTKVTDGIPFYIVIKHHNSIETWSSTTQIFYSGTLNYDFTLERNTAFGNNLIKIGSKWCIYSGDVNQDGTVDTLDLSQIESNGINYQISNAVCDLNKDNIVDLEDLIICDNNTTRNIIRKKPN